MNTKNTLAQNNKQNGGEIAVALSGGVDSAIAAVLLKDQGYRVHALFMKNWEEDDHDQHCAAHEDLHYAQAVCTQLDIPLTTVNFSHEYWERVFNDFVFQYQNGRTPNPDVVCNREIKFPLLIDYAKSLGIERLATGHYADLEYVDGSYHLLKGADTNKDQSYFLYMINQTVMEHIRFPLADLKKTDQTHPTCLLYTSPSPRDRQKSRMPSSA